MSNKYNILSGAATMLVDDSDIGFTRDGIGITKGLESRAIEADQQDTPLFQVIQGQSLQISTNLLEITLENIKFAWSESANITDNKLVIGKKTSTPPEHHVKIYGKRMDGNYVIIDIPKATVSAPGEGRFVKNGEFLLPVTLQALYDTEIDGLATVSISSTI
jgi:hypothetical protein